jgi:hypothetical protein
MSEEEKVVIKPDTSEYVESRAASGAKTKNNGDVVATGIAGATLDEIYELTAEALDTTDKELREKYGHLNQGMQRMNLGNRLRGVVGKMNKEKEGSGDKWFKSFSSGVQQAAKARFKEQEAARKEREKEAAAKAKAKAKAA